MAARQSGQPTSLGRSPLSLRLWRKASWLVLTATPGSGRSRRALGVAEGERRLVSRMTSAVISTNTPTPRAVALRCVTAPRPERLRLRRGGFRQVAQTAGELATEPRRAPEQVPIQRQASHRRAAIKGRKSDPARLCLADRSPMVRAAAGMASCEIVCVDGSMRLDWTGVYCGIENKGGTSPQWIKSRDGWTAH